MVQFLGYLPKPQFPELPNVGNALNTIASNIGDYRQQMDKNTLYDDQKRKEAEARSRAGAADAEAKKERAQKAAAAVGNAILGLPPEQQAVAWKRTLTLHPNMAQSLSQYGIDPNDHAAGANFFMNMHRGPQDPLDVQLKQAQIESTRSLAAQRASGGADSPQSRAAAAAQYGLDPNSDAGRSFILTGRLPREDQQSLTATDKKAILEADETVSSTEAAIAGLDRALALSSQAYDGATANERGWLTSQFGSQAGMATRELNQAVTQTALQQLKAIFGGNPTEGERKILLDIQGSAELPRQARDRILQSAKEAAIRRLQFNKQRAESMRGGTFYKPQAGQVAPQQTPGVMDLGDGFSAEFSP